jgi:phosphoribosylformylglycinamidine synthase
MKNDSVVGGVRISVPPTLLVTAIGQIDDARRALTLEPLAAGEAVFLIGATREETGGSEYFRHLGERDGVRSALGMPAQYVGNKVPRLSLAETLPRYRALARAIADGLVCSAGTPARGGLALALARAVLAGGLGLDVDLAAAPGIAGLAPAVALFAESAGRFLVTTRASDASEFAERMSELDCRRVGTVTADPRLQVRRGDERWIDLAAAEIKSAYEETLRDG